MENRLNLETFNELEEMIFDNIMNKISDEEFVEEIKSCMDDIDNYGTKFKKKQLFDVWFFIGEASNDDISLFSVSNINFEDEVITFLRDEDDLEEEYYISIPLFILNDSKDEIISYFKTNG